LQNHLAGERSELKGGAGDRSILDDDLARDPTEQTGAGPDQDRETVKHCHQQRAAGDDQRDAGRKTEGDQ